jgi:hypothetical protein
MSPETIEPDTKDWTWVVDRPCPDCGYDAGQVTVDQLPVAVRDNATAWEAVLAAPDVRARPAATVWSPLEYAAHIRDVHRVFLERVDLMLAAPADTVPTFPNWDQDATAVASDYASQDPAAVAEELLDAADAVAAAYEAVPPDGWGRRALRSNGSAFTLESLGRYHLHDVVHHLWDVGGPAWPYDPLVVHEVDE